MKPRIPFVLIAVLPGALLWELIGRLNVSFMPPLSDVLIAGVRVWSSERFLGSLGGSLTSLLIGFVIAAAAGIVIGVLMGRFDPVAWAIDWPRLVLPTPGGPTKHRIGPRVSWRRFSPAR